MTSVFNYIFSDGNCKFKSRNIRKTTFFGLIFLAAFAKVAVASEIEGTFTGQYSCGHNVYKIEIEISKNLGKGLVEFRRGSSAESGSYTVDVRVDGSNIIAVPNEWVNQIQSYEMVGFAASLKAGGRVLWGNIDSKNCGALRARVLSNDTPKLTSILKDYAPKLESVSEADTDRNFDQKKRFGEESRSSFRGLGFDINGIPLDLPIREALLRFNPGFRFREGTWSDSQGESKRVQTGFQAWGTGNIWDVREGVRVSPTPWHDGEYIISVRRSVDIKADAKKPTIEGFRKAVVDKYGNPTSTKSERGRGGMMSTYSMELMSYTVKDGAVKEVDCWPHELSPFNPLTLQSEKISFYRDMLTKIGSGWCDALLVNYYTEDGRNPGRIFRYGAVARDFRMEAASFLQDVKIKEETTRARQAATPEGAPKL